MTDKLLKIAILGGGKMAGQHAAAISTLENVELVAVADPVVPKGELETRFGSEVDVYRDAETLLEQAKPDVVHVVTPPATHVELARLALEHGAHVYVEKPFALSEDDARVLLGVAQERGLRACAAHQVLFQDAGRKYREHLDLIGDRVHVESYFSFKTVRRRADGKGSITPIEQLIDILPHPVYLLLSAFETDETPSMELCSLEVSPQGEVRALILVDGAPAVLVVTLRGRPIESYLRIVGTNGSVYADFILAGVTRLLGPGASAPAVVLRPFSEAWQRVVGSLTTLAKMVFRRHKSYPGLAELLERFYASIDGRGSPPVSPESILQTVRLCERIGHELQAAEETAESEAAEILKRAEAELTPPLTGRGALLVTGGTGFLGREVVSELRGRGWPVRVLARRLPGAAARVAGVEYIEADLVEDLPTDAFEGVEAVVHLAAETIGGKEAHERNTIEATHNVLERAGRHGIQKVIDISSIAVLKPSSEVGHPLREEDPVDSGNLGRGPYVWAKAEAEGLARNLAQRHGFSTRTVRLGPLVDYRKFTPPGRLGREVARLFVAAGSPSSELSVCDVTTAAQVIRYLTEHFDEAPRVINLVEAPPPTRRDLVQRLRTARPDLRVLWLPFPLIKLLGGLLKLALRALKPGKPPLDLYSAFASENYDTALAAKVIREARNDSPGVGDDLSKAQKVSDAIA
jgi:predicted dehydrogenase/nucleoside-diphosphate-sugar epimerase